VASAIQCAQFLADPRELEALLLEYGEATAGASVFLHKPGVASDGQLVVAVGQLIWPVSHQSWWFVSDPYQLAWLNTKAFGDNCGGWNLGEVAKHLVSTKPLGFSLGDQQRLALATPSALGVPVHSMSPSARPFANIGPLALGSDDQSLLLE